jgi:hypothetical protein
MLNLSVVSMVKIIFPSCDAYLFQKNLVVRLIARLGFDKFLGPPLGIDYKYLILLRVGAMALIWSLWLCRNDNFFNGKNYSLLQVIYRCTGTLRIWSQLHHLEDHDLFTEVCTRLEDTARHLFSQHVWQHNLWIGPPPS